ncbi:UNVERIFIED_ORG: hypothetical protein M2348_001282 [Sphingomonas sp. R1F5B]
MAKHTHTTYSCDRCKTDLGTTLPDHKQETVITASFNWREGPGPTFHWKDLCDPCRSAVRAFFLTSPVDMGVTASERREARVWWTEVSAFVNTDMAEYIMVRARRIMGTWKP